MPTSRRPACPFIFFLVFAAAAFGAWPQVESDLAPDPALVQGTLPNGLTYVLRPNAEPRGRVSLRLLVQVGSLHERDDERGLAHFLEHMIFRGTRPHPNGSLAKVLQRLGMGYGPHNTAFTTYGSTIYHLELPAADEATLRQGLSVVREYAEEVAFDPAAIELERGVVISEMDLRDTAEERIAKVNLALLWPDSRQAERRPIGEVDCIRKFTRDQFVDFYNAWYRPDRMAVIAVGEIQPELLTRLITEELGGLQPRGPARDDVIVEVPAAASKPSVSVLADPRITGINFCLEHPFAAPRVADTHARRVLLLHRNLAFAMFHRRVTKVAKAASAGDFLQPSTLVSDPLPGWSLASLGVSGKIISWQTVLSDLEREHRRAYVHGFTMAELRAAKTGFSTAYENSVRTVATWHSDWLAGQIANSLANGTVFTTPALLQKDIAADLEAATLEECTRAFRQTWTKSPPHLYIISHPTFQIAPRDIAIVLNKSRETPTPPLPEDKPLVFAYADLGPPGRIVRESTLPDLDVTQAQFANGVRLNFKPTPFEADTVEICLNVGTGQQSQPENLPGLDLLANVLVVQGGLGRHTFDEIGDLLTGHTVSIRFNTVSDAFVFSARCNRRDLEFCLKIITAHLIDSAYRPEAMREAQSSFGAMYSKLVESAGGLIAHFGPRQLASGDRRFGVPSATELYARTIPEVTAWIGPQFKTGPIELSVVGDTTWAETKAAVANSLGTLPDRQGRQPAQPPASFKIARKPAKPSYAYSTSPELRQVALVWYSPVPDLSGYKQERRCRLLADLLAERVRVRLRDELGAAYSCSAAFTMTDGFPAFSYFSVYAEVAPDLARKATVLVKKEFENVLKQHFTDDEFERARQPFIRTRLDDLRDNRYWSHTVLRDAQQRPMRLAAARDRTADIQAVTRAEVEALAKRYFKRDRWFSFVAFPPVSPTRTLPLPASD